MNKYQKKIIHNYEQGIVSYGDHIQIGHSPDKRWPKQVVWLSLVAYVNAFQINASQFKMVRAMGLHLCSLQWSWLRLDLLKSKLKQLQKCFKTRRSPSLRFLHVLDFFKKSLGLGLLVKYDQVEQFITSHPRDKESLNRKFIYYILIKSLPLMTHCISPISIKKNLSCSFFVF